ncbi:PhaR [Kurthia senegalensis]|uniref:PhaR n=1 Tax=Kurthia senegalensis TaxID=1033740 RepID=UPI000289AEA2|nr:PhaR [Kurthia senegalensis]
MANQTSFDAFSVWKDLYNQTESAFRDSIQSTLEQPAFAESLGNIQKQYLQYQGVVNGMTESYLKTLNIPTRDEIASLAKLVINTESKIIDLEDQLEHIGDRSENNAKEIKLLKSSVGKLDKKLDTIIELLSKQPNETIQKATVVNAATPQKTATKTQSTTTVKPSSQAKK